jgi:ribosomal protein L31E
MEREEAEQMNSYQAGLHADRVEALSSETDKVQAHADLLSQRVSMNIQMIMRRN